MGVSVSNLAELDLGADGIDYVEQCLRKGTGLCHKLLRLPLVSGKGLAPVPPQTNLDRAKSFEQGGLTAERDTIAWFGQHLDGLWDANPAGLLVVQDAWASPVDPPVRNAPSNRFVTRENVYYFIEKPAGRSFELTWRAVTSFFWVAVFTDAPVRPKAGARVTNEFIDELTRSTREIYVPAYDREGLVVWQR